MTYLITQGEGADEPEVLAIATTETLEKTIKRCAEQLSDDGADITTIRVWKLTNVALVTKAFGINGLDDLVKLY